MRQLRFQGLGTQAQALRQDGVRGTVVEQRAPRAATIVGQRGGHREALCAGQRRRAAALQRGQANGRQHAGRIGPQVPRLLHAPVRAGRGVVRGVLQVDRQPRQVGVRGAQLAAQGGQRLVEAVGMHRAAQAIAFARKAQRAGRGSAPDVDRQVIAHLVDEQVAAGGRDLIGP